MVVFLAQQASAFQPLGDSTPPDREEQPADSTVTGNTGEAQWTVPIELPPGPGGFAPTMALSYSSARSDSPFGMGWTVPVGQISCSVRFGTPRAFYSPSAPDCPRFELDGELLNLGAGRYHTQTESFQHIVHLTGLGVDHWEVTSPDGITRRYGTSPNSRIVAPSGRVVRWLLAEVESPYNQKVTYVYDGDPLAGGPDDNPTTGFTYIRSISYGPSASQPEREVVFLYETRPDPVTDFSGAVAREILHRAREIQVLSHGAPHSRYLLGYDLADIGEVPVAADYTTVRSRLSWVKRLASTCTATTNILTQCTTANGQALPAQEFRYTDANDLVGLPVWQAADFEADWPPWFSFDAGGPWWPAVHVSATRTGDINGDGLMDIIRSDESDVSPWAKFGIWINTGTGFERSAAWEQNFQDLSFTTWRADFDIVQIPGYEGVHGVCDATYSPVETGVYFGKSYESHQVNITFGQVNLVWEPEVPEDPHVQLGGSFHLVDINADGLDDLVMSARLSGVYLTHDCATEAERANPDRVEGGGKEVKVVFRNTGNGWVSDPALAANLPLLSMVMVEGDWALTDPEIWNTHGEAVSQCWKLIGPYYSAPSDYYLSSVFPCIGWANLSPSFVDLNGDGRLDMVVAQPDDVDSVIVVSPGIYAPAGLSSESRSVAWISQADGGWMRDPSFDLPFSHALLTYYDWADVPSTMDAGVRIVDRNRDGFADVTWAGEVYEPGSGVLLNQGGGDGQPYSAWCASRALSGSGIVDFYGVVPECPASAAAAQLELPAGEVFAIVGQSTMANGTELADLNGDGWLDLARASFVDGPAPETAFLFSPGAGWMEDSGYTLPGFLGSAPRGVGFQIVPADARFQDLDGDGAVDYIRGDASDDYPRGSWTGTRGLADLLREVRTGRGGTVSITYEGPSRQRSGTLEGDAESHAIAVAEPPGAGGDVLRWTTQPVVASVTVQGLNRAPATTSYRYAHPRYCPEHRSHLGYRLVERTNPDVSTTTTLFYQQHGRSGKLSERIVANASGILHTLEEVWDLPPPGTVTGGWPGDPAAGSEASFVGRLIERIAANEYGAATGAVQRVQYFYNDTYGYNFIGMVISDRPSTHTREIRTPEPADTANWIIGLLKASSLDTEFPIAPFVRWVEYQYTPQGKVQLQRVHQERRDGLGEPNPPPGETIFGYDGYGNLVSRTDPNGNQTEFCYDGNVAGAQWCSSPSGQTSGSVLVGRRDPGVDGEAGIVTDILPDQIFGVPLTVIPGYTDIPTTRDVVDPFGRAVASFVTPEGGTEVQVSAVDYVDDGATPYQIRYEYSREYANQAEALADEIRTVTFDDGFGGVWKIVRPADVPGAPKYMGTSTFHRVNPISGLNERTETYDIPCGDSLCTGLLGNEWPATITSSDALGRPVLVQTPNGTSHFHYSAATEEIIGSAGTAVLDAVDVVMAQNPADHLTRRSLDGDRLLAVEECTNINDAGAPLASVGCAAAISNRTLYAYNPVGQLKIIYDPLAVAASDWNNSSHHLRYFFDAAGRVIRIDDPDAGTSVSFYDIGGRLERTVNRTPAGSYERERILEYDELDRLTRITTTPTGEPDHILSYRTTELQLGSESTTQGYWKGIEYDGFGRVFQETLDAPTRAPDAIYQYDLQGRRVSVQYKGLEATKYIYEGAYLKKIECGGVNCPEGDAAVIFSDISYDDLGRRSVMSMPGSRSRTLTYTDALLGELRRHLKSDRFESPSGHTTLDYGLPDPLGNVLSWSTDSTMGGITASGSYSYDHRNRIKSWDSPTSGTEIFGYDELGNMVAHGASDGVSANQVFAHPTKPHAITARTDSLGAVTEAYEYDAWGNMIEAGLTRHYQYDSADRLVCVSTTSQHSCDVLKVYYDAQGMRIKEVSSTATRTFVGDEYVRTVFATDSKEWRAEIMAFGERVAYQTVFHEFGSASIQPPTEIPIAVLVLPPLAAVAWLALLGIRGRALVTVARRPGYATVVWVLVMTVSVPFPVQTGGGNSDWIPTFRWVISDRVDSGIATFDGNGDLFRQTRFKPFGGLDAETTSTGDRRFYGGHPQQEDTGLAYMKARWMSPVTGTFLSVDPLIVPSDPQSQTGYSYARNNPVSFTDPTGKIGTGAAVSALMGAGQTVMQESTVYTVGYDDGSTDEVTVVREDGQVVSVEGGNGHAQAAVFFAAAQSGADGQASDGSGEGQGAVGEALQEKYGVNEAETAVATESVSKFVAALQGYDAQGDATDEARERFNNIHRGRGNAFLHGYWGALMARRMGVDIAERFIEAHETGGPDSAAEQARDLANGRFGLGIGFVSHGLTDAQVADRIYQELESGNLQ